MNRICSTCRHEGCCEVLCGGSHWESAYVQCANCGREIDHELVDCEDEEGHAFCCMECHDKFHANDEEDE